MNNKKGGFGAKFALVLVLMIASAIGGAYGYRVLDGKLAVKDAMKAVEDVDISDYDTPEQTVIQGYIDDATKDLSTAKTRQEVYEIIGEFISDVSKVKTLKEKQLEEALKAAEEAKNANYNNQNNQNGQSDQTGENGQTGQNDTDYGTGTDTGEESGNYKSNDLNEPEKDENGGGFLGSLLGGLASGSDGN